MPEGCTVHQLNDIMREMENYLSQYEEIDMYQTRVASYDYAHINVTFRKEFENTNFPLMLREEIIRKAQSYGGANWRVVGIVEQGFSNYIGVGGWKSHSVKLTGYNYDMLYGYATRLVDSLAVDRRVSVPGIFSSEQFDSPENEFFIDYDLERVARTGINLAGYWQFLGEQLFEGSIGRVFDGESVTGVVLASSEKDAFDRWHIEHDMVRVDSIATRLGDIGTITMLRSGNDIVRRNQEYQLVVGFNYVGANELALRRVERSVEMMNDHVLPLGYKAEKSDRTYIMTSRDNWRMAGLLVLVIAIIYSLCAVIFESLRKPFTILLMIPVGFIGLFLTFAAGKFTFDQGGFAAMIMMCGIVVNAGIYIVNEYNIIRRRNPRSRAVSVYVKAYNRKIIPTLLTILSTVLGLIPFLFDGTDNVFWFAFAVGVMGSMLFSVLALVVYLPVFFPLNENKTLNRNENN
jgi:multidrug efflux pump subunit AcrB